MGEFQKNKTYLVGSSSDIESRLLADSQPVNIGLDIVVADKGIGSGLQELGQGLVADKTGSLGHQLGSRDEEVLVLLRVRNSVQLSSLGIPLDNVVVALGVDLILALQAGNPVQVLLLLNVVGVIVSVLWGLVRDMDLLMDMAVLVFLLDRLDELFLVQTPGTLEQLQTQLELGIAGVLAQDVGVKGLVARPVLADVDGIDQLADLDQEGDGLAVTSGETVKVLGASDLDFLEAGELLGERGDSGVGGHCSKVESCGGMEIKVRSRWVGLLVDEDP